MLKIAKSHLVQLSLPRNISCSTKMFLDQKWRESRGLPANPNEFGPLTNLPDYTFLDGRPTPMGSNQKKRLEKQREIAVKIVAMNNELESAKQRYIDMQEQKETEKQKIMEAKLKPKGKFMLTESK